MCLRVPGYVQQPGPDSVLSSDNRPAWGFSPAPSLGEGWSSEKKKKKREREREIYIYGP